jgi:hypothetical protein
MNDRCTRTADATPPPTKSTATSSRSQIPEPIQSTVAVLPSIGVAYSICPTRQRCGHVRSPARCVPGGSGRSRPAGGPDAPTAAAAARARQDWAAPPGSAGTASRRPRARPPAAERWWQQGQHTTQEPATEESDTDTKREIPCFDVDHVVLFRQGCGALRCHRAAPVL